ncbi:MAG TPA: hypothetical protein VNO79_02265 [Actinomycetota bacterium]|nr:hypothetical protein [Actinomycetota bacterium]
MRRRTWPLVVAFLALLAAGCSRFEAEEAEGPEPAHVEPIEGSEVARVTLEEYGAERIGLRTAPVEERGDRLVVPSAAVLVDPEGRFWVYTNPEGLVFVRHEVRVISDDGGRAILADGPPPGTRVVVVGAQELWGAESGVGH